MLILKGTIEQFSARIFRGGPGKCASALRSSRLSEPVRPRWISAAPWSRTGKRRLTGWKCCGAAWCTRDRVAHVCIDPEKYQGLCLRHGLERLTMLALPAVGDSCAFFFDNDLRVFEQFPLSAAPATF